MSESVRGVNKSAWAQCEAANGWPKNTPARTMDTPMTDASATRPGRILYIHRPVSRAAGIVTRIVNIPQALSLRAFTTTMATLDSVQTMMNSVTMEVVTPEMGPMVRRADFGGGRPSWRRRD